ncbi:MAG: hypothetical protein ACREF4_08945 [Gammaproteobacteria bacterium]
MKPVLIIPSIRDIVAERIAAVPEDVDIIVIDDSDGNIKPTRDRMKVFYYRDQQDVMGKDYDLIPHKTAACRNFAFYYVWKHTDHDLIITLDDDVFCPPHFMDAYRIVGTTGEWPNVQVDGWYNTIAALGVTGPGGRTLYPRGFPYWLRRPHEERMGTARGRMACIMGLWSHVLDYDGLDKYLFEEYRAMQDGVRPKLPVLTVGSPACPTKFSFCAMNFAFHRDLLPAAYQMPMDREISDGYRIWRFDDIWAGYVIEALVHRRGGQDLIAVGEPVGQHLKEGNLSREVGGEHYGHLMSPYFYDLVDIGVAATPPGTYAAMYLSLWSHLERNFDAVCREVRCPTLYQTYFRETFTRLRRWAELFQ